MAELILPTHLNHAHVSIRYLESTGLTVNPYTGAVRTASLGGDRIGASLEWIPYGGPTQRAEAAQLRHAIASFRGKQNRVYLFDQSYTRRGVFPASELVANNTFADGTTGWAPLQATLTAADRIARLTVTNVAANPQFNRAVTLTQYAPHIIRSMIYDGRGSTGIAIGPAISDATGQNQSYVTTRGLISAVYVPPTGGAGTANAVVFADLTGYTAGTYVECPYVSVSRCALADAGPNALLRSDELDNASWTKVGLTSVTANASGAPDGSATADDMLENSANSSHHITQSGSRTSVAADICSFGYFKRIVGTRNLFLWAGNDGANGGSAVFDLGAGTIIAGPTNNGTATNARAFVVNAGNGWFFCCVIARCPAAATLANFSQMANGTSTTYTGDGTSIVSGWRVGCAVSSVPTRGGQTTSVAAASGTAQSGTGIHLKGLPTSTNGLLAIDDWVEVISSRGSELKKVTARLNSDAAGLGFLQVVPPVRGTLADNAAVIVHNPFGRFVCMTDSPGWDNSPGVFTRASAEFVEATD